VYPGSFDPITFGHIDIIERASSVFDKVIVAISRNAEKDPLFSEIERIDLIRQCITDIPNVVVDNFEGLLVNYVQSQNAQSIIRGLRAISDFEFEFRMALMNRSLNEDVTTLFLMPHAKFTHVSSSLVREVAKLKGDISSLVPENVAIAVKNKYR